MAKWGAGDPRWIVEERADATNVNNWHWTEKNATLWSKDKLKELLTGMTIENDDFKATIKEVTKTEGEATANNRKAKLIFFYEWVISGEWEGSHKNGDNKTNYKGTFDVPNLSEENDPKDIDVNVTIKNEKHFELKEFMRIEGSKKIREQCVKYVALLREEFSQGLIKPTKDNAGNMPVTSPGAVNKPATTAVAASETTNGGNKNKSNEPTKLETKKLTMKEEFKCRAAELYNVFTDVDLVKAFTQTSTLVYEAKKGGNFSLFDGNITGSFIELVPTSKIVMKWRNKRWSPDDHFSTVTLEFNEKEDCTFLNLTQTSVPQNFVENTQDGWRNFYFNAIRQKFGYGSRLI